MNKEVDRSQRKALGKGLSALLPNRTKPVELEPPILEKPAHTPAQGTAVAKKTLPEHFDDFESLDVSSIEAGEEQPRDAFDQEKLTELAHSIKVHGVIQPITVRRMGPDRFQIIAGERRWRAAKLAGLSNIPALVRSSAGGDLLELALIENIQREDLNPIEIALAFQRLSAHHGLSHEQIAERTGKERSTVTNFLRLLKLSEKARAELISGAITMGHARALVNATPDQQGEICDQIKRDHLSVRDTESLVKRLTDRPGLSSGSKPTKDSPEHLTDPNIRAAVDSMSEALGTRVTLHNKSATSGWLEVEYYTSEDLERIYSVIVKER